LRLLNLNGLNYSYESCDYFLLFQGRKIYSYFIEVNDEFLNVIGYRVAFKENENELIEIGNKIKDQGQTEILISYLSKLAAINCILYRNMTENMILFFDYDLFCMKNYQCNNIVHASLSGFGLSENISFILNKGDTYKFCWKTLISELYLLNPKNYKYNVKLSLLNDMSFSYEDIAGIKLCIGRFNRLGLAVIVENVHCLNKLRALKKLGVHYFS